jgi:hypothetical protein
LCEKIAGSLEVIIIIIILMMDPSSWAFVFSKYMSNAANTDAIYSFCFVVAMQQQFSSCMSRGQTDLNENGR